MLDIMNLKRNVYIYTHHIYIHTISVCIHTYRYYLSIYIYIYFALYLLQFYEIVKESF